MDSTRSRFACVAVAALLSAIPFSAQPCGDKLAPLGGGVAFDRVIASRHPGRIVLLLEPSSALAAADAEFNISAALSLAGHDVAIATDPAGLEAVLADAPTDIVLVDALRAGELHAMASARQQGPTLLSVLYGAGQELAGTTERQDGCAVDVGERGGRRLLQAVERTLKLRKRGEAPPCEGHTGQQRA